MVAKVLVAVKRDRVEEEVEGLGGRRRCAREVERWDDCRDGRRMAVWRSGC